MKELHIGAIFLGILTILAFSGSTAHGLYHHVDSCTICHYGDQEPAECAASANLMLIKDEIDTPNSGSRGTLFGPYVAGAPDYNGICEVCHTTTTYHRNSATGDHTHYASENCIPCHKHTNEFGHGGGQSCDVCHGHAGGDGTAFSHGTHTAGTVPRGPATAMVCGDCHDTNNFPLFGADGAQETLAATAVCDPCHSQGGAYDGIAMAKSEWGAGIYQIDGQSLKSGNETWCVGCHDSEGATISGRTADDLAGDDAMYGYFASGHGYYSVGCTDCHDPQFTHIDAYDQTYHAAEAMDGPRGYQQGFRLKSVNGIRPLYMPRLYTSPDPPPAPYTSDWMDPNHFALCYDCHLENQIEGTAFSGFTDLTAQDYYDFVNLHWTQIVVGSPTSIGSHLGMEIDYWWDSDRLGGYDSGFTCTTCHDPHSRLPFKGRATYSMTRQDMSISHVREATQAYGYMSTDDWNNGGGDLNCQGACHPLSYGKKYYYQLGTEPPEAFPFLTNLDAGGDVSSPQSGTGGLLLGGSFDGYTGMFGGAQTGLRVDADGEGATFPTSNMNSNNGAYGETIAFWYVPDFNVSDKAGTGEVETLFHSYVDSNNWIRIQVYNNKLQFQIVTGGSTHYLRTAGLDWLAGDPHYIVCTWGPAAGMHIFLDRLEADYNVDTGLSYVGGTGSLAANFSVGNSADGLEPADGIIDDFKMYGYQHRDFSAGLTLFSKLDSSGSVSSPVIGDGGSTSASFTTIRAQHNASARFMSPYYLHTVEFPTSNLNNAEGAIDFWFYPDFNLYDNTGNTNKFLFFCTEDVNNQVEIRVYNNRFQFRIEVNAVNHILRTKTIGNGYSQGGGYMWYHLVCTWGPDGMHMYINGDEAEYKAEQQGGLTYYGPLFDPEPLPANFRIGNRSDNNTTYYCDGFIDELRVYDYQVVP
ncbi:MAG: LamG-like jellyroll fold domain-containing protein [Thermodesulfobacteriota bacterium]|nr:LamG-like jellyroll fold domain-containing protein [Thermodesulfobacteriota bacterium]